MKIVIDSSVLIGLLNPNDHWHSHTTTFFSAIQATDTELIYLDCVIAESVSTVLRRLTEQGRMDEIEPLFERLDAYAPQSDINWFLPQVPAFYTDILTLMRSTNGELNFHDALIAIICREQQIPTIASYDRDFDQISWLKRIASPEDLTKAISLEDFSQKD
ncbi:MAG: type II toxin-antitoxin system VapC family toxin [Chloroflexota bacterium]